MSLEGEPARAKRTRKPSSKRTVEAETPLEAYVLERGHIEVGDGHSIFFERMGNPRARAIYHNHGGPGAGITDSHKRLYDFNRHHVIFPRQRGVGESRPKGGLVQNTTRSLVEDINIVRANLGITGEMYVTGGSWGSTLSLAYATRYPKNVKAMGLWSIYLGRPQDNDDLYRDKSSDANFPFQENRARFRNAVPPADRLNAKTVCAYFKRNLENLPTDEAERLAREYHLNTYVSCALPGRTPEELEADIAKDPDSISGALIETHFIGSMHERDFDPDILDRVHLVRHIPTTAVHGTLDHCTHIQQAYDLKAAWPELNLVVVPSGHIRYDERGMKQGIQIAIRDFV